MKCLGFGKTQHSTVECRLGTLFRCQGEKTALAHAASTLICNHAKYEKKLTPSLVLEFAFHDSFLACFGFLLKKINGILAQICRDNLF